MTKKLDYKKMLIDIYTLTESEGFGFEMEMKLLPNAKKYTQAEAKKMADIIGRIYGVAHCLTCTACQTKYLK